MAYNRVKTSPVNNEIIESREIVDDGAALFNLAFPGPHNAQVFDQHFWQQSTAVSAGRGSAWFVSDSTDKFVLRHYKRGGAMAAVLDNKYVFRSQDSTRSFAEFRLLAYMWQLGLPVPEPCAARYQRSGVFYTAQLITRRLADTVAWSEQLDSKSMDQVWWTQIGQLVGRFHTHNIDHADLNVDNILVKDTGEIYLIDFDKGLVRTSHQAPWQQRNLRRLRRSIVKRLHHGEATSGFEEGWNQLISAYEVVVQR